MPRFDGRQFRDEILRYEKMLQNPPAEARQLNPGRYRASELLNPGSGHMVFVPGDLEIVRLAIC
jgi:hypothetical protein